MMHGFLSSGLTETQYESACKAAGIGALGERTFDTVMEKYGYFEVVETLCNESMATVREEEMASDAYKASDGACVITDARHDSSRSAAHTTVSALSHSTQKVVGFKNQRMASGISAVRREVPMTQDLVTELCDILRFKISEIAHDYVPALKKWFEEVREILNSYDSWHGSRSVSTAMKNVSSGPKKDMGIKWFEQLSDKAKATRTHFYYTMKENSGNAEEFQEQLLNVVEHYKGNHANCNSQSRCTYAGYVMSKQKLTDDKAIDAYTKAIKSTTIYRYPECYMRCRSTFYIESFHNAILMYEPKRINFGDKAHDMRIRLAVLDWNENVGRDVSSTQFYQHSRHPHRLAETRVLTSKTFKFRNEIWHRLFSKHN